MHLSLCLHSFFFSLFLRLDRYECARRVVVGVVGFYHVDLFIPFVVVAVLHMSDVFGFSYFLMARRVVAVDLRGYGDSDKPNGRDAYKIDRLVNDVRQIIEMLGMFFGYSDTNEKFGHVFDVFRSMKCSHWRVGIYGRESHKNVAVISFFLLAIFTLPPSWATTNKTWIVDTLDTRVWRRVNNSVRVLGASRKSRFLFTCSESVETRILARDSKLLVGHDLHRSATVHIEKKNYKNVDKKIQKFKPVTDWQKERDRPRQWPTWARQTDHWPSACVATSSQLDRDNNGRLFSRLKWAEPKVTCLLALLG